MFEDIIRIIRSVSREMKDNTMAKQNMTIRQVSTTHKDKDLMRYTNPDRTRVPIAILFRN